MADYYVYGTNLKNKEYFTSVVSTEKGQKRYFSNIDAEIYFGDVDVTDDICDFKFTVEERQLPIYSYNKFFPDIIVPGQRIVQGVFAVNFTNGAYMKNLLSSIDDSVLNMMNFDEQLYNPGSIDQNHALWNKNFDITLGYGDYKTDNPTIGATMQTLSGVRIQSMEKGMSTDGKPILEIYSFIAKTFVEDGGSIGGFSDTTESTSSDNKESDNKKESDGNIVTDKNGFSVEVIMHTNNREEGYIGVKVTHDDYTISKDTCSTGTLEILDKDVINYVEEGGVNDGFSKVFTMEYNTGQKMYYKDLDKSRPIVRKLLYYFNNNKSGKVKVNFKCKITTKDKKYEINEDTKMILK